MNSLLRRDTTRSLLLAPHSPNNGPMPKRHPPIRLGILLATILALSSTQALANAFTSLDPRSMSLGGAGVAATRPYNAPAFNPARLAGNPQIEGRRDDRAFSRAFGGIRLIDRDGFLDSLDRFQENDNQSRLKQSLDQLEARISDQSVTRQDLRAVFRTADELLDDYQSLSDKPLRLAASAGFNLGAPGERFGFGASIRQNAVVGMELRISQEDISQVRQVIDFIEVLMDIIDEEVIPPDLELPDVGDDLTSDFALRGAMVREVGLSVGARIPQQPRTYLGVNLKSLQIDTLDWETDVERARTENFELDDQRLIHADVNVDLGVVHELDDGWSAGMMVRNLIPRDYRTVLGNQVPLRPTFRGGLAWQNPRWTVAVDMDLNETVAIGFDPAKQYLAMGVEHRPLRWLSLRGGYRYERVLEEGNISLGIGLSSRRSHFDLALSGDAGDSFGAAMQFGVRF